MEAQDHVCPHVDITIVYAPPLPRARVVYPGSFGTWIEELRLSLTSLLGIGETRHNFRMFVDTMDRGNSQEYTGDRTSPVT